MKYCVLDKSKICNNCGECDNRCELDPTKICDNCFKCLNLDGMQDYAEIEITDIVTDKEDMNEEDDDY